MIPRIGIERTSQRDRGRGRSRARRRYRSGSLMEHWGLMLYLKDRQPSKTTSSYSQSCTESQDDLAPGNPGLSWLRSTHNPKDGAWLLWRTECRICHILRVYRVSRVLCCVSTCLL